jgi:hypothetical protein
MAGLVLAGPGHPPLGSSGRSYSKSPGRKPYPFGEPRTTDDQLKPSDTLAFATVSSGVPDVSISVQPTTPSW